MVLVLDDPREATDDGADDEGEDQQRLEQFGGVGERAVEVHRDIDCSKRGKGGMLGREGLSALSDGSRVRPSADVLHDVRVLLTAHVQAGVVGSAHGQEVWSGVSSHQLKHVCDQGSGTQAERMHPNEAHGSANEGVEVASCSVDVGLRRHASSPPGHAAEQDGLPNHDRDGGSSEGQAEQHEQWDDFVRGLDVRQAQAPVVAREPGLGRFEDVRPLQEVQADHE